MLALGLVLIPLGTSAIGIFIRRLNADIGEGVIFQLRRSLFAHLQRMSLRFFTNTRSGELISRLNNDVVNAQTAISDTIVGAVTNIIQVVATLLVMFSLEWRLTVLGLAGVIGTALVYWIGGHLVLQGVFTIGMITAFSAYLGQLYYPLEYLINIPVEFSRSMVSFERVFEVIDLPLEIAEKPDARALSNVRGELVFDHVSFRYAPSDEGLLTEVERIGQNIQAVLSGEAEVQNGQETDDPSEITQAREIALEDISFTVQPGQLTALVGPSGAGKTTLTYLIPRLYDPTGGRILLDGVDLRDLTLASLAAQIGMVTQETYLFHDTIRTNLLYARLDATQAEVEAAASAANIHNFIAALPNGYNTVVGERGYRLSGGEKQRLAIARVILKNPRILVLDEATSHLDSQSEALIQEALEKIMVNRTSIVIAHRLSTILAADQILVLDRGRIVERGTHHELVGQGGLYTHLYETQFGRAAKNAVC